MTSQPLQSPLPVSSSKRAYSVRLARPQELEEVFRLRYDIFYTEMGAHSLDTDQRSDTDLYDTICDHLVVLDEGTIVGTYRLLPLSRLSNTTLAPYSQTEFDLQPIRDEYGDSQILELGRSCIHADHRSGLTARMLWAGIAKYLLENQIQALLGCVSVHDVSDVQANRLVSVFQQNNMWDERFHLPIDNSYRIESRYSSSETDPQLSLVPQDGTRLVPPLMKGYFNLGAKVCGGPAKDQQFHCHDFLMLLDVDHMSERYYNSFVMPLTTRGMLGSMATTLT